LELCLAVNLLQQENKQDSAPYYQHVYTLVSYMHSEHTFFGSLISSAVGAVVAAAWTDTATGVVKLLVTSGKTLQVADVNAG
jgi:hypothetical protein